MRIAELLGYVAIQRYEAGVTGDALAVPSSPRDAP